MAVGFKVADAYVQIHTEDDTKPTRDKIGRDTDKWAKDTGDRAGKSLGARIGRGLLVGFTTAISSLLKLTLITSIVGVIGAAVSALGGYIVQLMGAVTQLAGALWSALGVLVLIPGAIFTMISAMAVLKLGFSGLGQALKDGLSGDMAAFEQSLAKLAPAAQEVARAIVGLKPAFDDLKKSVQQNLLLDMGAALEELAVVYLPLLERGLGNVAHGLNSVFRAVVGSLLDPYSSRNIEAALNSVGRILDNLAYGLQPLLTALTQVLSVSTGILADLSDRWGEIMQGWADAITAIPEDQWGLWVEDGLAAVKQIGHAIGQMFSIVGAVFRAAGESDFFGWLDRLNEWVNSSSGFTLLTTLFQTLRDAANALTPSLYELGRVLTGLLTEFSGVMVAIGPVLEQLIHSLGEVLMPAIAPLGDVVVQVGKILIGLLDGLAKSDALPVLIQTLAIALEALGKVAEPVGQALGELIKAIAPLLVVTGDLLAAALLGLAQVLLTILPVLTPAIQLFADLFHDFIGSWIDAVESSGVLGVLTRAMQELADTLRPAMPILTAFITDFFEEMLAAFQEIQPILLQAFLDILQTVTEMLPGLVEEFKPLIPIWAEMSKQIGEYLVDAIIALAPYIPQLVEALLQLIPPFVDFFLALSPIAPQLVLIAIALVRDLMPIFLDIYPSLIDLVVAFTELLKAVTEKGPSGYSLLDVFVALALWLVELNLKAGPLRIMVDNLAVAMWILASGMAGVAAIAQNVASWVRWLKDRFDELGGGVEGARGKLKGAVESLPGVVASALGNTGNLLWSAGANIIQGLINGINSKIGALSTALRNITNLIPSWKGPMDVDRQLLVPSGQATMQGYIAGIQSQVPSLRSALAQLTAAIPGMAGDPGALALALAAGNGGQGVNVAVYIGEKPVREMVAAEIKDQPELVSVAAREGDRKRAFVDPGRRTVGV